MLYLRCPIHWCAIDGDDDACDGAAAEGAAKLASHLTLMSLDVVCVALEAETVVSVLCVFEVLQDSFAGIPGL